MPPIPQLIVIVLIPRLIVAWGGGGGGGVGDVGISGILGWHQCFHAVHSMLSHQEAILPLLGVMLRSHCEYLMKRRWIIT